MVEAVQGRAKRCARRPNKWAAKNAKDRCKCGHSTDLGERPRTHLPIYLRTLVHSDRKVGVRVVAARGLNMNRETVRRIVKEDL
jgi:hypothetical protein